MNSLQEITAFFGMEAYCVSTAELNGKVFLCCRRTWEDAESEEDQTYWQLVIIPLYLTTEEVTTKDGKTGKVTHYTSGNYTNTEKIFKSIPFDYSGPYDWLTISRLYVEDGYLKVLYMEGKDTSYIIGELTIDDSLELMSDGTIDSGTLEKTNSGTEGGDIPLAYNNDLIYVPTYTTYSRTTGKYRYYVKFGNSISCYAFGDSKGLVEYNGSICNVECMGNSAYLNGNLIGSSSATINDITYFKYLDSLYVLTIDNNGSVDIYLFYNSLSYAAKNSFSANKGAAISACCYQDQVFIMCGEADDNIPATIYTISIGNLMNGTPTVWNAVTSSILHLGQPYFHQENQCMDIDGLPVMWSREFDGPSILQFADVQVENPIPPNIPVIPPFDIIPFEPSPIGPIPITPVPLPPLIPEPPFIILDYKSYYARNVLVGFMVPEIPEGMTIYFRLNATRQDNTRETKDTINDDFKLDNADFPKSGVTSTDTGKLVYTEIDIGTGTTVKLSIDVGVSS